MPLFPHVFHRKLEVEKFALWRCLWMFLFVTACGGGPPPPPPGLPPSATDLNVLGPLHLCETKATARQQGMVKASRPSPWGSGEEWFGPGSHSPHQWLYFDEDDVLIGALFGFPHGLALKPYPILRDTLSQLPPSREFFVNASSLLRGTEPETVVLYRTGDKTSTTQYIVRQTADEEGEMLVVGMTLDPYESLLDGTQSKFLSPSGAGDHHEGASRQKVDKKFLVHQQFARGEAALFKSCGQSRVDIAIDAYRRAVQLGFDDPTSTAEVHHHLGLALRDKGQLQEAQAELEQALVIRPYDPAILNHMGRVLMQQNHHSEAIANFEKAIAIKPNYMRARFNLASAYESVNPKRAIEEYETYLALAEGIPDEAARAALAQKRLLKIKPNL